jgi:hypothetical protein
MIRPARIKPLTEFLRNSKTHIGILKPTVEAELLTVNGEASIVVQDAESYQPLIELAEQARQDERLRQALRAVKNAEPADQVLSRLRKKHVKAP